MERPDWNFWKQKAKVEAKIELWQAVCLSFDIDPDPQREMHQRYGKSHSQKEMYEMYSKSHYGTRNDKVFERLELLIDSLHLEQFFRPQTIIRSEPKFQTIFLSELVAWCLYMDYDIPQELAALAKKPDAAPVTKEKNKQTTPVKTPSPIKVEAKPFASPSNDDWTVEAVTIANREGNKRWACGDRQITARNICDKVATELGKNNKYWGNRGAREGGTIRSVALKGWKFIPPKSGTNGTNGTKEQSTFFMPLKKR